jgi:23S rRNA (pseudouridine1915-N3)-methyltransferase
VRIHVIAVGRLKQGPERELADRYRSRFEDAGRKLGFRGLIVHEISESRARDAAGRIADESAAIGGIMPERATIAALDERGESLGSEAFAQRLGRRRDSGTGDMIYVIGGADGLSPDLRRKAVETISFGAATWPHQLVRVMLLEQLYRAVTLLAGHPYHRA